MPLDSLAGHRPTLTLLSRAAAAGTLPPSLILAGPEGVGKLQAAMAIAEVLNCLSPVQGGQFAIDACGACAACRRIARRIHPDVSLVVPGDNGSISAVTPGAAIWIRQSSGQKVVSRMNSVSTVTNSDFPNSSMTESSSVWVVITCMKSLRSTG